MEKNINEIIVNWEKEITSKQNTLYKYNELTIKELEEIISKSKIVNEFLQKFIKKAMTEDEIIKKYGEDCSTVLVSYALINNLLNEPVIVDDEAMMNTSDSEKLYWQDIKRLESFTQEKTIEYLAKYTECLKKAQESSNKEEKEKYEKKAIFYRNSIVEGNMRLVISAIKRYHPQGMQFLDLVNEGNIGLIKAVEKFEINRGYKFSTYAYASIRRNVTRAIADKSRVVRQPVHFTELSYHVNKAREEFYNKYHREATVEDLEKMLDGITVDRIRDVFTLDVEPVSLDSKVHNQDEDENATLGNFIASKEKSPEELVFRSDNKQQVREMLTVLTEREKYVIEERWGLNSGRAKTLEEVGEELSVTRERIRQIEVKALRKLRGFAKSSVSEYINNNSASFNVDNMYSGKKLINILGYTYPDFEIYKSRLDKSTKIYEILLLLFGKNFNEVYTSELVTTNEIKLFHNYIIKCTTEREKLKKKYVNKNISEISNLPAECIECYLKDIDKDDPKYIFLKKMFGNKFNHRLKEEELSIPVMEKIDYIVMELKKMFAQDDLIERSGYQNKTLMGILNINSEDVEWLMNSQNKLTKSYEIIVKAFGLDGMSIYDGTNLTTNEKNVLFALLKAWKRKVIRKNMDLTESEIEIGDTQISIKAQVKKDLLPEIIKMLPMDCRMIVGLSLGLYNGKAYSVKDIASFYQKSEEEVISLLKKGLTGIEEILKYYKTIYNGKINYSEKDLSILKRVQEIKRN